MTSKYSSECFKIDANVYIKRLALSWLGSHWWIFVIPLILIAIWSVSDLRAIYVGLILIFIIYPFALSFIWFNYAFSPGTRKQLSHKRLMFNEECVEIHYYRNEETTDAFDSDIYKWSELAGMEDGNKYVSIIVSGTRIDDIVLIPTQILENEVWMFIRQHLPNNDNL